MYGSSVLTAMPAERLVKRAGLRLKAYELFPEKECTQCICYVSYGRDTLSLAAVSSELKMHLLR